MEWLKLSSEQKRKVRLGLIITAFLVSLILVFFAGRGYQKQIPSESEKYLQEQVLEYRKEIEGWKERFRIISVEKAKLEQSVQNLENQVISIRDFYDQKIITVKSYSNAELEQFFSERYPD